MKFSTRARYAIRSMTEFARRTAKNRPVSLATIAKCTNISRRYLEQIVISLKSARLLRSVPGRHGGYLLTKPPRKILIGQIVEAMIGPVNVVECVGNPTMCMKSDGCACRTIYTLINKGINQVLNDYSLDDMLDERHEGKIGRHRRN